MGAQALGVLVIGVGGIVAGVECGKAVEVAAAVLADGVGEGETEVAPLGVCGCDVGAGGFDTLCDGLDVGCYVIAGGWCDGLRLVLV